MKTYEVCVFEVNEDNYGDLLYTYDILVYTEDGIYVVQDDPNTGNPVGNRSYRERTVVSDTNSYEEAIDEIALLVGTECNIEEFDEFFIWNYFKWHEDEYEEEGEVTTSLFAVRKDGRVQEIRKISDDFDQVWASKALPNEGCYWYTKENFNLRDVPGYSTLRAAYAQLLACGGSCGNMENQGASAP